MDTRRILFVDDDANLLSGLRRMLYSFRRDWDMTFVEDPRRALELIDAGTKFDLVLTDLSMPGMDGVQFLEQISIKLPLSVRFILSGQTDSKSLLRASTVTHQVLTKPCDGMILHNLMARALSLSRSFDHSPIKRNLMLMGGLPSMPIIHREIMTEMELPSPSIARIGQIIEQDAGLTVKLLQIVNNNFVSSGRKITTVMEAVHVLGLENVKGLVLMVEVFSPLQWQESGDTLGVESLWEHCLRVGWTARRIAEAEGQNERIAHVAFTAGLLHKLGLLVLGTKFPNEFASVLDKMTHAHAVLSTVERDCYGATHGEVGGFLLDLWGIPDSIVEAVSFYDFPSGLPDTTYREREEEDFNILGVVHVAYYFCSIDDEITRFLGPARIDTGYLDRHGLTQKLLSWSDVVFQD